MSAGYFYSLCNPAIRSYPKPVFLPVNKTEATEFDHHYQMQHISETAKILQCVSE
jgi:hypothetical protein